MSDLSSSLVGRPRERPAHALQAQRRELWKGKTWDEMNPSERASYAARKRWDARRMREEMPADAGADARHDARQGAPMTSTAQALYGLSTPVSGVAPHESQTAASRAVLVGIRDNPKALPSDRIRAVDLLHRLDSGTDSAQVDAAAEWLAMGEALSLLPVRERLAFLSRAAGLPPLRLPDGMAESDDAVETLDGEPHRHHTSSPAPK
jgi:hypothetical protein